LSFLHSKYIPNAKMTKVHKLGLFDSHSFVSKFPLPQTEREQVKFMQELEAAHMRGIGRRRKEVSMIG